MDLSTLQTQFLSALQNQRVPDLLSQIKERGDLSAKQRLNIYRNSQITVRLNALSEIYTVCEQLVGNDFFSAMANRYLEDISCHQPDISEIGNHFPEFIATFPHARSVPYLSDVARLEQAWHRTFLAADVGVFDLNTFAMQSEATQMLSQVRLNPSAQLLRSAFPILSIWQAHQPESSSKIFVEDMTQGVFLLIWRDHYTQKMDVLSEGEWTILNDIAQHPRSLAELAMSAVQTENKLATLLPYLIQRRWVLLL